MARVQFRQLGIDAFYDAVDALDQRRAVALGQVGPTEAAVLEDQVAGEEDLGVGSVETEVVVFVAGRVQGDVLVIAERDRLLVFDRVVDALLCRIVPPRVDVEGVFHRGEVPHVVRVGVGHHDRLEVVDALAKRRDDVEVRTGVDENRPLAGDEKDVTRERGHSLREIRDHGDRYGGACFVRIEGCWRSIDLTEVSHVRRSIRLVGHDAFARRVELLCMIVLHGGSVVDATGTRTADVAIENGRIAAVGDVPADADREIDVSGQFVTPGLIDAHVHLAFDGRPDVSTYRTENDYAGAYRVAANLETLLEVGVTTVRDLGSWGTMAIDAARAVDEGTIAGPRVLAAGRAVTMTGGHGHWFAREADGPADVRKAAREQLKGGAPVLKCIATGGVLTTGSRTGAPELTRAELEAAADVARAADVPIAAHAHGAEGIVNAAEAGFDSVEHGTFMDADAAERLADNGTYWVPTANALYGIVEAGSDAGIPPEAVAKAERSLESFDDAFDHALAADVPIAMGTDAGTPFNEFAAVPEELERLVDHGLSPEAALEAATVDAASLLGLDDVGLVDPSFRADLLVLDANPLEDVTAWQRPATVVANGTIVKRP